jgi:hypothetical protein
MLRVGCGCEEASKSSRKATAWGLALVALGEKSGLLSWGNIRAGGLVGVELVEKGKSDITPTLRREYRAGVGLWWCFVEWHCR